MNAAKAIAGIIRVPATMCGLCEVANERCENHGRRRDGRPGSAPLRGCLASRQAWRFFRDYSNVHADVQALKAAGLLDTSDGGVHADYDAIETKIAI
jgi:hypothetical protein